MKKEIELTTSINFRASDAQRKALSEMSVALSEKSGRLMNGSDVARLAHERGMAMLKQELDLGLLNVDARSEVERIVGLAESFARIGAKTVKQKLAQQ